MTTFAEYTFLLALTSARLLKGLNYEDFLTKNNGWMQIYLFLEAHS